jgi:protein SCO1/2
MKATITIISLKLRLMILMWTGLAVNLGGGPAWAAPAGSPWGANYFPNVELISQDGERFHFYDDLLKNKVVAINFIYTRCTAACPLETAAMRKIYHALGDHMGRDVFFYTISIDADHDDPAELKAYAARYKTGPGWTFLTGRKQDVTLIRQKLGMYRADGKAEQDFSEHSTTILMGSEKLGQWIKRSPYEEPQALARILKARLLRRHDAPKPMVAEAADPLHDSPGAKLFRANCAACHGMGSESGIGPGLAGVMQNRDRAWLRRWIKEPDRLIRAKDPLAVSLFEQYDRVYMPNLKLNDRDVDELMAYMDAATRPQAQASR